MFLLPVERLFAFFLIFTNFWPLGTSEIMIFRWEVLHFSENHFFCFIPEFFANFLNFALLLVDLGVWGLHLGSQKAPRALGPSRARPPFCACFSSGDLRGRFGSLRGRFGSLRGWFLAHFWLILAHSGLILANFSSFFVNFSSFFLDFPVFPRNLSIFSSLFAPFLPSWDLPGLFLSQGPKRKIPTPLRHP